MPVSTSSSSMTSPSWRMPAGDAGDQPADRVSALTARGNTKPNSRITRSERSVMVPADLESGVAAGGDLVAAAAVLGDPGRAGHVHALLAGNIGTVVPGVAGRVDEHSGRHQRGRVPDPLALRRRQ